MNTTHAPHHALADDVVIRRGLLVLDEVATQLAPQLRRPADELAQLGACGFLETLRRYDPARAPLGPYAATRARWAILDGLRRELRRPSRSPARGEGAPRAPDPTCDAEQRLEDRLVVARAMKVIHGLPRRERVVMERLYVQGDTLAVAASELGLSRSRACRLHRRALASVRAALESLPSVPPA